MLEMQETDCLQRKLLRLGRHHHRLQALLQGKCQDREQIRRQHGNKHTNIKSVRHNFIGSISRKRNYKYQDFFNHRSTAKWRKLRHHNTK